MAGNARSIALSVMALTLLLGACSSNTEVRGGASTPVPTTSAPSKPSSVSPEPSIIADGVLEPTDAPTPPPQNPNIPRASEAPEAVKYAQGFAAALLYYDVLYTPNAEKRGVEILQSPPGLSITRLVDWYEYVKSDSAYRSNQNTVDGYLFIPPDRDNRRYAIPAVQELEYSEPTISPGPPSSIDSRPTLQVSFFVRGELVWIERDETVWSAPIGRKISYVMASQNDGWVIDEWKNAAVEIGKAKRVIDAKAALYSFTPWESDTEIDFPFPVGE